MLLLLCSKTCGNWEGLVWYISITSIYISSIVSQVEKAMYPWCKLLSHCGIQFHEVLERFVWNGCLLCNQVRGFVKYTLRNRGGTRVRCPGCYYLFTGPSRTAEYLHADRHSNPACLKSVQICSSSCLLNNVVRNLPIHFGPSCTCI